MIIKDINIRNFRSYYKDNSLSLAKGLTLVIGDNGDGKTAMFEALEWLFDTSVENKKDSNISEKRKAEMEVGEVDTLSVSITFEHNGDFEVEKSFIFEKKGENSFAIRDFKFKGYENVGSERLSIDGKELLDKRCFETVIRKYCLFKGENELNVFDNETTLKTLVDTFSGVRKFDELVNLTTSFEKASANAANRELTKDANTSKRATELNNQLRIIDAEISDLKSEIDEKEGYISDFKRKLELIEKNQEASERYQTIKGRIEALREKRATCASHADCNFDTILLDKMWILRPFPSVLSEFSSKVFALGREKRKLSDQEKERVARLQGEKDAIKKMQTLANDAVPLPWNLPDKETMQDMIKDEVCKVCGRPAPKGSDAYKFMVEKLNDYLQHIQAEAINNNATDEEHKPLFPNTYINELNTRKIRISGEVEQEVNGIASDIVKAMEFISDMKSRRDNFDKEIAELELEQNTLLMQSGLSAELLDKNFTDWKGFTEANHKYSIQVAELKIELNNKEQKKAEIQQQLLELNPGNSVAKVYQKVHTAFDDIMKAFISATDKNVANFLMLMEEHANYYLKLLNKNDFYGIIKIRRTIGNSAKIELYSENNVRIDNPNGALKTTMYMSVLFAISKITTLKREQNYPLIFDAPTSSFGGFKEDAFYNVIDGIDKQCLIVTKDLLDVDKVTGEKQLDATTINKLSCSVYRIEKVMPFREKDLSTIQTVIKKIK